MIKKWSRRNSDHCPISVFIQAQDWGPKPFKGFNVWLLNPELQQLMRDEIASLSTRNKVDYFGLLRGVKMKVKEWSAVKYDDLGSSIREFELSLEKADEGEADKGEVAEIQSKLSHFYSIWSDILRQKSRIQWDLEGDKNKRFFHQSIQKRRAQNTIRGILRNGVWVEEPDMVKRAVFDHFCEVFTENHEELLFQFDSCIKKKLTSSDQEKLVRNFSLEEIEVALKESSDNRAPGPDGLNFKWIKSIWPAVELKVKEFFENFYNTGDIPRGANSSFIALIPKVTGAKQMSDFRPISPINCSIKLLFKVLANRIKPSLHSLIAEEQSAFIPGRNIGDGILLANEIIHSMRGLGGDGIIMKIDFAKAYDSVNWNCLLHIMDCMNFGSKWKMWIQAILNSTNMSVLVNGSPTPEFKPGKGLRQGDPLAPYLFILVGVALAFIGIF